MIEACDNIDTNDTIQPESPSNKDNKNINELEHHVELDISSKKNDDNNSETSSEGHNYNNIIKHMLNLYENNLITSEDLSIILERLKDKTNEKYWTKEYTDIISCICEKAQCYRYMHEKSSDFYKNLSKKLTFANIIFSFLMSSYTIVSSEIEYMDVNVTALISGIGHLIIASLTGVQNKMNLPEKSESHSKSCSDFDTFCRELEYQLRLPVEDRQIVPKYVLSSIDKYENIVFSSPKIPSKILQGFRYWASTTNLNIDQPSIVKTFVNVHDLNKKEIYYDQDKLDDNLKYMKEFIDCKHIYQHSPTPRGKHKHKKTNRTPKIKRIIHQTQSNGNLTNTKSEEDFQNLIKKQLNNVENI